MIKKNNDGIEIVRYNPKLNRDGVINIFHSMPDLFSKRERKCIAKETNYPPDEEHLKFIAMDKSHVVGYIGAFLASDSKESWLLDWFAVKKTYQGKGIGTNLLRTVEANLQKISGFKLFIETCSCEGELPARSFYEKKGYKQVATLPDFYSKGHSKIIYLKRIFL